MRTHRPPTLRLLISLGLLLALRAPAEDFLPPAPPTAEERASVYLEALADTPLENFWSHVAELTRLAAGQPKVVAMLRQAQNSPNEKTRLGAAGALRRLSVTEDVLPVLCELAAQASSPEIRRAAAGVIGAGALLDEDDQTAESLRKILDQERDELTRCALARALWRVCGRKEGKEAVISLFRTSADASLRDEAALVLGEMGFVSSRSEWAGRPEADLYRAVTARIAELRFDPTPRGERALQQYREMEEHALRLGELRVQRGERLVREILGHLSRAYADREKLEDLDKLFEGAARGLVAGLDQFSHYLDKHEAALTQEQLRQDYGGIGAYVGVRNRQFTIISPIFGSPADRAGLKAQDIILEVDGVKVSDLLKEGSQTSVIAKLKGRPGVPVRLKYYRRGLVKPVEVELVRDLIRVESVFYVLLPGKLGYVRIARFGEKTAQELETAVQDLVRKQGAQGLLLDLRDNPGGLLRAAVEVADHFLAQGKLIVYSEGYKEFAPRRDFLATGGPEEEAQPMVVLVNRGSASASEIVAGALQDHKRAVVVGERTFGKGSVQQLIPLRATFRETQLRLTVAKYFLPLGRCIHGAGVEPDVTAREPETDDWVLRQVLALRRKNYFEQYARERFAERQELFARLAEDDGGRLDAYPDAEAVRKEVESYRLPDDALRAELRRAVRQLVQDERKRLFPCDLEGDPQLQRAALELLAKLKLDPEELTPYRQYARQLKAAKGAEAPENALIPPEEEP